MITRRTLMHTLPTILLGTALPAAAQSGLSFSVLHAAETSFSKTAVLITGPRDAILVDGMFTQSEGRMAVEAIRATGKRLTTVFVSHADPDYYFSLEPVRAAFPDARIVATPDIAAAIQRTVAKKIETWGARLGAEGPRQPILPEAFAGTELTLDGHTVEIITPEPVTLPDRAFLYVPSLSAVVGGILVFAGLHVWTADAATLEARAAWRRALGSIEVRGAKVVVPGHAPAGQSQDMSAVRFTHDYLLTFDEEAARTSDGAGLIAAMRRRYPDLGLGIALEIGAKVAKGEMKWG